MDCRGFAGGVMVSLQPFKSMPGQIPHVRPVVIILDQVEEVFTRPNEDQPEELAEFIAALEPLFASRDHRPKGKLVLSFRKEWLAEIERRLKEKALPRRKVFLERLDRRGIVEAITGPARAERLRVYSLRSLAR